MKNIIKILFVVLMCLTSFQIHTVYAEESIPTHFQPKTIIKYLDSQNYIIVDYQENLYNEKTFEEVAREDVPIVQNDEYILENYPKPFKDMYIHYDENGDVNRIYFPKGLDISSTFTYSIVKKNMTRGVDDPHYTLVAKWGSFPNYLYKGVNNYNYKYYGTGRATNYNDEIGQRNNKLVKGDVATHMTYDNCAYGTDVRVSMKNSTGKMYTRTMKKRDVGGMPNAIIDIWDKGVQYWGYEYSESFGKAVTIEHD